MAGARWDDALARVHFEHWGRILGRLTARHGRVDLAEDALAEAFAQAAEQWRREVPRNPPGWITTTAERRLLDLLRAEAVRRRKAPLLLEPDPPGADHEPAPAEAGGDERLRMLWLATHPALALEVRPALALRLVLGVPTEQIARLFLVPVPTMAARLTRAKRRIAAAGIELPADSEPWPVERGDDVARTLLLAYSAGYLHPSPADGSIPAEAVADAVRLAVLASRLLPDHPALAGVAALVTLQHARRDARVDASGRLVLLADQDRRLWRQDESAAGLRRFAALERTTGYAEEVRLMACVAALHAIAPRAADTDWARIAAVYARLEELTGSPVVRLNRAVAVAQTRGPAAGLELLDAAAHELPGHHRVQVVRGELLARDGLSGPAREAFRRALASCPTGAERDHIERRLAELPAP